MQTKFSLQPGDTVSVQGRPCRIRSVLNLDSVLLEDQATGIPQKVTISELLDTPQRPTKATHNSDIQQLPEDDLNTARYRLRVIEPLLGSKLRQETVEECAKHAGVHKVTIYRWLAKYRRIGTLESLVPRKASAGQGTKRLPAIQEEIIKSAIESHFLTQPPPKVASTKREVDARCHRAGVASPHLRTLKKRLDAVSEAIKVQRRSGRNSARRFEPIRGKFPHADYPLAVVQVDHTKLDVIVVDDIDRQPIGRPWITLAIDVFSRMVIGFYTSLDFPGNLSTGLCLAHAILPKDAWLRKRGCDGEWPCWGIMQSVHLDNAKEFRGNMLRRACQQYGIDILWRPVGKPNFGGHIERLLGTLLTVLHTLPGTTFSNPKQKGEYNSTRASSMTLTELEKWIATYLVDVYHRRIHFALNTTPLAKYNEGILGTPSKPGCGLPPVVSDPERLRLDFMPYVERTIQNYGVLINGIHYYHDVLRPWVNALEDGSPRRKRKFIFKCDPRDVSLISFYDPNLEEYRPIPYRDTSRPAVSLWELKQAQRRLKADGKKHVDEPAIFEALQRMHEITQQATKKTMSARRRDQRIRDHLNPARLQLVAMGFEPKSPQPPRPSTLQATVGPKDSDVIEPFDDLQLL